MDDCAGVKSLQSDTGLSENPLTKSLRVRVSHAYSSSCHDVQFAKIGLVAT